MLRKMLVIGLLVLAPVALFGGCGEGNGAEPEASAKAGGEQEQERATGATSLDQEEVEGSLAANVESERAKEESKGEEVLAEEATVAVEETHEAIDAIDQNKQADAVAALERAVGKLEILLARKPELSLVPLETTTQVVNPVVEPSTVEGLREKVEKSIDDGNFQAARIALEAMASEIQVTTVNLPLATYPVAIKQAAKLLEDGKAKEAKDVLQHALSTLILVERRVPLPVVNAQHLVKLASEKPVAERDGVIELLSRAQEELKLAESLGYGFRERDWADLDEEIRNLKRSIESDEESGSLFGSLRESLREFRARLSGDETT